jgi:hypothetical protein
MGGGRLAESAQQPAAQGMPVGARKSFKARLGRGGAAESATDERAGGFFCRGHPRLYQYYEKQASTKQRTARIRAQAPKLVFFPFLWHIPCISAERFVVFRPRAELVVNGAFPMEGLGRYE